MLGIDKKNNTVNLDVNNVFEKAVPVLKTAWLILGLDCVVTSGKDGKHSVNSAHYAGNALDLRIWGIDSYMDLNVFGFHLAAALRRVCGDGFYVVLEGDHIHLEYSLGIPNIKGWKKEKFFYDGISK